MASTKSVLNSAISAAVNAPKAQHQGVTHVNGRTNGSVGKTGTPKQPGTTWPGGGGGGYGYGSYGGGGSSGPQTTINKENTNFRKNPDRNAQAAAEATPKLSLANLKAAKDQFDRNYEDTMAANAVQTAADFIDSERVIWHPNVQAIQSMFDEQSNNFGGAGKYSSNVERLDYGTAREDDIMDQKLLYTIANNLNDVYQNAYNKSVQGVLERNANLDQLKNEFGNEVIPTLIKNVQDTLGSTTVGSSTTNTKSNNSGSTGTTDSTIKQTATTTTDANKYLKNKAATDQKVRSAQSTVDKLTAALKAAKNTASRQKTQAELAKAQKALDAAKKEAAKWNTSDVNWSAINNLFGGHSGINKNGAFYTDIFGDYYELPTLQRQNWFRTLGNINSAIRRKA